MLDLNQSWLVHRKCPGKSTFIPWTFIGNKSNNNKTYYVSCPFPLEGHTVPISVLGRRPFIVNTANGVDIDLMKILAGKFKFTSKLIRMKSRTSETFYFKVLNNFI